MAKVWRSDGDDSHPKSFSTWAPLAVARIGDLQSTLEDRSILVRMRRRKKHELVSKYREGNLEAATLRAKATRWALDNLAAINSSDPVLPEQLHDR